MKSALSPRFLVRRAGPGLGYGLFADEKIKKGEFMLEYTGRQIPTAEADRLDTRYLFEIDSDWTIDGSPRTNTARYINHACTPNTEAEIEGGRILIYAVRDIEAGEELTIDYGEEYFDEFIRPTGCKCGACSRQEKVMI